MAAKASAARPRENEQDHPAFGYLRGALYLIDQSGGKPTVELLNNIRTSVQTAVDVLLETDPLKQRIAFILLALRQSTAVHEKMMFGKPKVFVAITDPPLYSWAMAEVHKIAGAP